MFRKPVGGNTLSKGSQVTLHPMLTENITYIPNITTTFARIFKSKRVLNGYDYTKAINEFATSPPTKLISFDLEDFVLEVKSTNRGVTVKQALKALGKKWQSKS